jgi:hypothetical protein
VGDPTLRAARVAPRGFQRRARLGHTRIGGKQRREQREAIDTAGLRAGREPRRVVLRRRRIERPRRLAGDARLEMDGRGRDMRAAAYPRQQQRQRPAMEPAPGLTIASHVPVPQYLKA